MGMLSHGLTGLLQEGQRDPGNIMDCSLGIRYMHTLRKEPTTEPRTKTVRYRDISDAHTAYFRYLLFELVDILFYLFYLLYSI